MEGMMEHLKWQAQLSGAQMGSGNVGSSGGSGYTSGSSHTSPQASDDDAPDIGMMVPIEKA